MDQNQVFLFSCFLLIALKYIHIKKSKQVTSSLINLFFSIVLHTSASLALNESWDPDVRDDMEMMLNKIVPEGLEYRHSCEGPDDMVSSTLLKIFLF